MDALNPLDLLCLWGLAMLVSAALYNLLRALVRRTGGIVRAFFNLFYYASTYALSLLVLPLIVVGTLLWAVAEVVRLPHLFITRSLFRFREHLARSVASLLLVVALLTTLGSLWMHLTSAAPDLRGWIEGWLKDFGNGMLGAYVTYILINLLLGAKERRKQQTENRTLALTRWRLAETPRARQLLFADLVTLNYLRGVKLSGEDLRGYDLQNADLRGASFTGCNLSGANLRGVVIYGTSFQNANLRDAILSEVQWSASPKRPTDFTGADLCGAVIDETPPPRRGLNIQVSLEDITADIQHADIILPDGSVWSDENTFARFTAPQSHA